MDQISEVSLSELVPKDEMFCEVQSFTTTLPELHPLYIPLFSKANNESLYDLNLGLFRKSYVLGPAERIIF